MKPYNSSRIYKAYLLFFIIFKIIYIYDFFIINFIFINIKINFNIFLKYCLIEINKINKLRHPKYDKLIKYTDEYYLIMIYH